MRLTPVREFSDIENNLSAEIKDKGNCDQKNLLIEAKKHNNE